MSQATSITQAQRATRAHPCRICGGWDNQRRGKGQRCSGYLSADGLYAYCTREEYAGQLAPNTRTSPAAWAHRLHGPCKCGATHGPALVSSAKARSGSPATRTRRRTPEPTPIRPDRLDASTPATPSTERSAHPHTRERIAATYDYRDAAGALVYQVVRYELTDTDTGERIGKTFRQRRPASPGTPGRRGSWVGNLDGVTRVLYRLPDLLAALASDPGALVYVVEGEKCADALAAGGLVATCNAGGAGKWREEYSEALRGRHVVILPDADPYRADKPHESYTGQRHAVAVAGSLAGVAASVRVLALDGLDAKGDVYDWLNADAGHTCAELDTLARVAPVWTGSPAQLAELMPEASAGDPLDALDGQDGNGAPAGHPSGDQLDASTPRRIASTAARTERGPSRRSADQLDAGDESDADSEYLPGALALCETRYGSLLYAPDAPTPGIYVAPRRGAPYCILSARIELLQVDASEGATRGSRYHVAFTSPLQPDRPVHAVLTHDSAMSGAAYDENGLAGLLQSAPTGKTECEIAWKAIRAFATLAIQNNPAIRTRRVQRLGWHEGAWVRVNGYIDAAGAHTDARIVAAVDEEWPQRLPENLDALPVQLHADSIRRLLDFWPRDMTLFPLAMWGACAFIMRPEHTGTARWELELFGNSDWLKTTFINWTFRAFFGAGYTYQTAPLLRGGKGSDSPIGRLGARSKMRYHAYLTYDYSAKPGQPDYVTQQEDRLQSAHATGDGAQGGIVGTRDGDIRSRLAPQGLLVRAGEPDPRQYSIPQGAWSDDSRLVTYCIPGLATFAESKARKAISQACALAVRDLDALAIWHVQWLASHDPATGQDQWRRIRESAARLVAAEDAREDYPRRHNRVLEQCEDIAAGLISYCLFLRALDADAGAFARVIVGGAQLAEDIKHAIPELIRERFAASDDLARRYEETQGGITPRDALATAVCLAIQNGLRDGWRLTSQDSELPSEANLIPCEEPAPHLLHAGLQGEALGWERAPVYGSSAPTWKARRDSHPLGCEYDAGRYVACDKTELAALIRHAAPHDKRITYTTMTRLLADLHAVGAIVGGGEKDHPYTQQVRRKGERRAARMVCFPRERIWPDRFAGSPEMDPDAQPDTETDSDETRACNLLRHLSPPGTTGTPGTPGTASIAVLAASPEYSGARGLFDNTAATLDGAKMGQKAVPGAMSKTGTASIAELRECDVLDTNASATERERFDPFAHDSDAPETREGAKWKGGDGK